MSPGSASTSVFVSAPSVLTGAALAAALGPGGKKEWVRACTLACPDVVVELCVDIAVMVVVELVMVVVVELVVVVVVQLLVVMRWWWYS